MKDLDGFRNYLKTIEDALPDLVSAAETDFDFWPLHQHQEAFDQLIKTINAIDEFLEHINIVTSLAAEMDAAFIRIQKVRELQLRLKKLVKKDSNDKFAEWLKKMTKPYYLH